MQRTGRGQLGIRELLGGRNGEEGIVRRELFAHCVEMDSHTSYGGSIQSATILSVTVALFYYFFRYHDAHNIASMYTSDEGATGND